MASFSYLNTRRKYLTRQLLALLTALIRLQINSKIRVYVRYSLCRAYKIAYNAQISRPKIEMICELTGKLILQGF